MRILMEVSMKMNRIVQFGIAATMLILVLGLAVSCGDKDGDKNTAALLTGLSVAGITAEVPTAISRANWVDESFTPEPGQISTVNVDDPALLQSAALIRATVSKGAKVAYGRAYGSSKPDQDDPDQVFTATSTLSLSSSQSLYVRVTSEDGATVNYYRFTIWLRSGNSQLDILTVAGVRANLGVPGTALDNIEAEGTLSLGNSLKNQAVLVGTPVIVRATVEYAVTGSSGTPEFGTTATYDFNDADYLYVKVTSENGLSFSYYKIEVQIGRDATLDRITIGGTDASKLGAPGDSSNYAPWNPTLGTSGVNANKLNYDRSTQGDYSADMRMPVEGFTVEIVPNDEDADVSWALESEWRNVNPSYGTTSPIQFANESFLYVKVVAANGNATNYYRIRIIMKNWAPVYRGTPVINTATKYIDPIWDAEDWLDVSRFNTAESFQQFFMTTPHTTAKTKALWDDDGLWVYWDIDFISPYTDNAGASQNRVFTPTGPSMTSDHHNRDSVELFINERFQTWKAGDYGNQYRVSGDNVKTGDAAIPLAGDFAASPPAGDPIRAFINDNTSSSAWVKDNNAGYVVIMRGPWYFNKLHEGIEPITQDVIDEANEVFDADGKVKVGAEIGVEFQVNACATRGSSTTRDAILTWNGITGQSYNQVRNFGIVTLEVRE
jgi:hypothetical protein